MILDSHTSYLYTFLECVLLIVMTQQLYLNTFDIQVGIQGLATITCLMCGGWAKFTCESQLRLNSQLHKLAQRYTSIKLNNPREVREGGSLMLLNRFIWSKDNKSQIIL